MTSPSAVDAIGSTVAAESPQPPEFDFTVCVTLNSVCIASAAAVRNTGGWHNARACRIGRPAVWFYVIATHTLAGRRTRALDQARVAQELYRDSAVSPGRVRDRDARAEVLAGYWRPLRFIQLGHGFYFGLAILGVH